MTIKDGIKLGIGFILGNMIVEVVSGIIVQKIFDNSEDYRNRVKETDPARYERMVKMRNNQSEEE